ncbi:MAG TPA: NAD(P)/FAD-dependent oxidoreductase [Treponemataceae bacterium]|nr:NAD(P)/FAD-dependent oxidoreductase [Treponemataceae bacterium]
MKKADVIIIGKGPAGISAAIYLARAKKSVIVIGKDFGSLEKAHSIDNYYGLEKSLTGLELAERGVSQAERLGVSIHTAEVTVIEPLYPSSSDTKEQFKVIAAEPGQNETTSTKTLEFTGQSLLIATGKERTGLRIPGFEDYKGKGISFCAACDGFFYKGKQLAVIGNGTFAATELNYLYNVTKDIRLFTNGKDLEEGVKELLPAEVPVIKDTITSIRGSSPSGDGGVVSGICTAPKNKNGDESTCKLYQVQGIFVALGTAGAASFAAHLGLQTREGTDSGSLLVNDDFSTAIPGIYSAGDATGGFLQIAKAVSDGAHAATSLIKYLNQSRLAK